MKQRFVFAALFALLAATPSYADSSIFQADSKINVKSILVANNTTAIPVSGPATMYGIEAFNNSTTIAYVKVYNAASATCGSGTPQARYMIPASTSATYTNNTNGDAYGAGITVCVTTGYADSDTTAPTASEYIVNVHYK